MTKIRKIILTTIVLMLLAPVALAVDWKNYGTDADDSVWYYDTQSISRGQDTIKVWVKRILSDKAKASMIKKFRKYNGIESISYTLSRWEIDCSRNADRTTSWVWYGSEGDVIHRRDFGDRPMQSSDVAPDSASALSALVKIICEKNAGGK